ncbi:MAG TPA: FAD-dependent monooxygenase [Gammaproteobacteria bacterium]|nr:FAD-dependent monooxygenase [Gammaproteobacteria bacterium]
MTDFDIAIIGGGLVGTTLAIKLKNSGFKICLVEAFDPPQHQQATEDMRSIALNYQSREIFKKLGIWDEIESLSTPIKKIHVSEKGAFGHTLLDAEELDVDSFGSVIPIVYLYTLLQKKLSECNNVELLRPAKLSSLSQHPDHWELEINQKKVATKFLIAADGDKSFIREFLKLPTEKTDFHQTALVSTLLASKDHNNTAYERFTKLGVLALLPLQNNRVACIWTCDNHNMENIKNNFVEITQEYIGHRLGKLSQPGNIQTYPIYEISAKIQTLPRFILLGNSAHVLHPVAAQGFNLSLRDADGLADILLKSKDLADANIQANYINLRKSDQDNTSKMTNMIIKVFKPQQFPLPCLRGTGLFVFNLMTPLKNKFCERAMGL